MLRNRKFNLYISMMSLWLLILSAPVFAYRVLKPSSTITNPVGARYYPNPDHVDPSDGGPFIHWSSPTITFKKHLDGTSQNNNGFNEFTDINSAFQAWENVSAINFVDGGTTSAENSPSDGQNVVFWSDDFNDDVIGIALISYYNSTARFIDVDIALNDDEDVVKWKATTDLNADPVEWRVKDVVIHEVGHLLGLGHSDASGAVMYIDHNVFTLRADDREGIDYLYGGGANDPLHVPDVFQDVREALEFATSPQTVEVKSDESVRLIGVHPSNVATVKAGVTLDIKPGATILLGPSERLKVSGGFKAAGNSSDPIKFQRRIASSAWHSISIEGGVLYNFDWCEVDGASYAGLKIHGPAGASSIANSTFKNCGDGIQISNADTVIRDTDVYDNNYGIRVIGTSQPDLGSSNNGDNNIYDNSVWDLYVTSSNDFKAEGNYWGTSTPEDVIYHGNDNASYGTVDFNPFSTGLAAPPSLVKFPVNPPPAAVATPMVTAAYQNFPNPFNPETWMPYDLGEEAEVTITIYNTSGNIIRTLPLGIQPAGKYTNRSKAAYWNGRSDTDELVSSGVYFYRLKMGNYHATKKLLILK